MSAEGTATGPEADRQVFTGHAGRYVVEHRLGTGSTAIVYRVVDEEGCPRALKASLLGGAGESVDLMSEADRLERYTVTEIERFGDGEARFPRVHDRDPEGRWFVMDLAEGQTLEEVLSTGRALRPSQCVAIARRLSEALAIVEHHDERATDLKPDAIFWTRATDQLTIVDWNVVGDDTSSPGAPSHVRLVSGLLDALLARQRIAAWDGTGAAPDRWTAHPRKYPRVIVRLLRRWSTDEGVGLEEVRADLSALDTPLERACASIRDARSMNATDPTAAREAEDYAAFAALDPQRETRFRAEELLDRARGYLGDDRPRLVGLWSHLTNPTDAQKMPDPGNALELIRLRALVGVARRAPGYSDEVRRIAELFSDQLWRPAAESADRLAQTIGDADIDRLLTDVAHEGRLFADMAQALRRMDRADHRAAAESMDRVRDTLGQLAHADHFLRRFDAFQRAFEEVDAPSLDTGRTPVARPDIPDPMMEARRRFATESDTRLDGLGSLRDSEAGRALARLIDAWQSVYDASTRDARAGCARFITALQASAEHGGCLPLAELDRHGQGILRQLEDGFRSVQSREEAVDLLNLARQVLPALTSVQQALNGSALEADVRDAIRRALSGLEDRLHAWIQIADDALSAFDVCREQMRALSLSQRLVRVETLLEQAGRLGLARQLHAELVATVHRESLDLSGKYSESDVDAARVTLGLEPLQKNRSGILTGAAFLVVIALVAIAGWYVLGLIETTSHIRDANVSVGTVDAGIQPDAELAAAPDAALTATDTSFEPDESVRPDTSRPSPSTSRRNRRRPLRRNPERRRTPRGRDAGLAIPSVRIKVYSRPAEPDGATGKPRGEFPIPRGLDQGL